MAQRGLGRRFNQLWAAVAAGNLGDGVYRVAIGLLAARLTSDPLAFSVLTALGFLPWLVLGLPSGVLVDRYDRRRLALLVGVVRTGVLAVLLVAVAADRASLWLLYTVVLVLGSCETVYDNAVGSMVPAVVGDRERLETANGRLLGAELVAQSFIGPPLASAVFALLAGAAFGINVACYAIAVVLMLALPGTYRATAGQPVRMVQAMGQGLRFVRRHWVHRNLLSVVVVLGFANAMSTALVVLWSRETLGVPEAAFGFFLLTSAVGALAGSQSAAWVAARAGRGRTMALAAIVTGLGLLLAAATRSVYVAALGWALTGWAILVWNVVYGSLRQRLTPDALLGRTIGIYRVFAWGVMPLGALAGGALAKVGAGDLRTPILVGAVLTLAAGGYAALQFSNARIDAAVAEADKNAEEGRTAEEGGNDEEGRNPGEVRTAEIGEDAGTGEAAVSGGRGAA
ncbi:MFS transporter [Dactylosporangium cerinum]|uniref:MFS transporter n=1 Tax=Dactylosporangium cerinum TaxID=1434730 RepID=A0ABV9W477_9ACTN